MTEAAWRKAYTKRLRKLIAESGLSQRDLAKKAGVNEATIANAAYGRSIPNTYTTYCICKALGCKDLSDLVPLK